MHFQTSVHLNIWKYVNIFFCKYVNVYMCKYVKYEFIDICIYVYM